MFFWGISEIVRKGVDKEQLVEELLNTHTIDDDCIWRLKKRGEEYENMYFIW